MKRGLTTRMIRIMKILLLVGKQLSKRLSNGCPYQWLIKIKKEMSEKSWRSHLLTHWELKVTKLLIQVKICQRTTLHWLSVPLFLHICLLRRSRNNRAAIIFWWSITIISKCLNLLSTRATTNISTTITLVTKPIRNRLAPVLAYTSNSSRQRIQVVAEGRKASIMCATVTLNSWQLIRMHLELRHRGTRHFRYNNRQLLSHQVAKPTSKQLTIIKDSADRLG